MKMSYFIVLMALAALGGCGRDEAPKAVQEAGRPAEPAAEADAAEQQEAADPVLELCRKAEDMFYSGATNETEILLFNALGDEDFAAGRRQIMSMYAGVLLANGRIDAAKAFVKDVLANSPDMADAVMGAVYFRHAGAGEYREALEWTDEVLAMPGLAPQIVRNYIEWGLGAALAAGEDEKVVEKAGRLFAMAPANDSVPILRRAMEDMLAKGRFKLLASVLEKAGSSVSSDKATMNLIATMRLLVMASQKNWQGFADSFAKCTAGFPDREILYVLQRSLPAAIKDRQFAVVDAVCHKVLDSSDENRLSFQYSARQWVAAAKAQDPAEVPARLAVLADKGRDLDEIGSIFVRHAYDLIDDLKFVSAMLPTAERLAVGVSGDDWRSSIRTVLLDYAFLLEDYDAAIRIIEGRIGGYDDNWHAMALAKVKAHKAMKEQNPLEAIREFRKFMAIVQASEEETTSDPSTGATHTREMILGRNAARIAQLYESASDAENAKKAYDEARGYFTKALETVTDPESVEIIRKELGAISGR